ncbi:hypothetical protein LCGC14_0458860 [marine sediment metagenome]|uniref:SprT-like domain-containing protein n=1 Tax=marine sediment metagenome TaxID=412755 RepID=A0A0F9VPM0_9ZZZZ
MTNLRIETLKKKVDAKIKWCREKVLEKYNHAIFPDIRYDLTGTSRTGICKYKGNIIRLNPHILKEYEDDYINTTVAHEFAHLAVYHILGHRAKPHGREWKWMMRFLEAPPNRCSDYNMQAIVENTSMKVRRKTARPYLYKCGCTEHRLTSNIHIKMLKGQRRSCLKCRQRITYIGTI